MQTFFLLTKHINSNKSSHNNVSAHVAWQILIMDRNKHEIKPAKKCFSDKHCHKASQLDLIGTLLWFDYIKLHYLTGWQTHWQMTLLQKFAALCVNISPVKSIFNWSSNMRLLLQQQHWFLFAHLNIPSCAPVLWRESQKYVLHKGEIRHKKT